MSVAKDVAFGLDGLKEIKVGVDIIADAVKVTLGPRGRNAIIERSFGPPSITKDGVSVAKEIELVDPLQNMGAAMVREAATKAGDDAGDGPQPLYSKVLTPTGFVTMGELKVGDVICGTNNTFQEVLEIHPKGEKEIVKVYFSCGRVVECCEDHVWDVTMLNGRRKVTSTRELLEHGVSKEQPDGRKTHLYCTPKTSVDFADAELPLDPYLLGVLLGDGSLSGTGSIEIALGARKEHIIAKLVLPAGFELAIKWVESKHYFRVKIKGTDASGRTIHDVVGSLGLLGVTSGTKHIPHRYLYSSLESRTKLLQGLLDTDGCATSRGLFEFSTISDKMKEDFTTLCLSMGTSLHYHLHTREDDANSYSSTPIHRFATLKGYKHGERIDRMERTGEKTLMQCIKVSNPDSLYITDGFVVTHNTTSVSVLTQAIFGEGYKLVVAGSQPIELKRGIDKMTQLLLKEIKEIARPVTTSREVAQVGAISANNEQEIGDLIAEAMDTVGKNGVVTIDESPDDKTYLEHVEGFEFDRGWRDTSRHFLAQQKDGGETLTLKDPYILCYGKSFNSFEGLKDLLTATQRTGKALLIIAPSFSTIVMDILAQNCIRGVQVAAVVSPGFGEHKEAYLEDLAYATNGHIVGVGGLDFEKVAKDLTVLGSAGKVIIRKTATTIIDGRGNAAELTKRIESLVAMAEASKSDFDKEKIQERIGKLSGGIAVIRVGGYTEVEVKEKKDRVEDALCATRAAVLSGIVPGGGAALLMAKRAVMKIKDWGCTSADQTLGCELMLRAVESPIRCIVSNSGGMPDVVVQRIMSGKAKGYNAHTDKFEDLFVSGVVDPAKVTLVALSTAASTAGALLTTSCAITNHREKQMGIFADAQTIG